MASGRWGGQNIHISTVALGRLQELESAGAPTGLDKWEKMTIELSAQGVTQEEMSKVLPYAQSSLAAKRHRAIDKVSIAYLQYNAFKRELSNICNTKQSASVIKLLGEYFDQWK